MFLNGYFLFVQQFFSVIDATAKETMEVKVFDPTLGMSDQKMLELLREAALENHGYKVENTTKLVTEPGSDKPIYRKSVLYYKVVDCSRLQEIDQELQTLLPGKILTFYLFPMLRKLINNNKKDVAFSVFLWSTFCIKWSIFWLVADVFKLNLVQKINSEIKSKDLTKMKQCRVGLEVHFKQGCSDQKKNVRRRKRGCFLCLFCWSAKLAN